MSKDELVISAPDEAKTPVSEDAVQGKDLNKILGGDEKEGAQEDKAEKPAESPKDDSDTVSEIVIEQPVVEGEVPSEDDFSDIDGSFGLDDLPEDVEAIVAASAEMEDKAEGEADAKPEACEKPEEEDKGSESDDGKVAPAAPEEQQIAIFKDGKQVNSAEEAEEEPKEEKVSGLIDPLKAEIELNGAKEDVAKEDEELPESLEKPLSATAAANAKPDVKELTISSLEACPKGSAYEAKIIQPGKKAILFAVDANGNFKPVLELNANLAAESNARFFQSQADLDHVIYEITKDQDFRPELKDFAALGARDFKFTAPVSEVLHNRIESGIANVTASIQRDEEGHIECLEQSLKIAFLEMVKGIREDVPNAVREELVARIRSLGVEDAANIVDSAFRDAGEQFAKDLIRRTIALSGKPVEVRNEAADNAVQSKFKRGDEHVAKSADIPNVAVASALHDGSTPFQGAPSKETYTKVQASHDGDFFARFGSMMNTSKR